MRDASQCFGEFFERLENPHGHELYLNQHDRSVRCCRCGNGFYEGVDIDYARKFIATVPCEPPVEKMKRQAYLGTR